MGLKRPFTVLDESAPVSLSAVIGGHHRSARDDVSNKTDPDPDPKVEVKRSISEDLSIEEERRRKRLCCLASRTESERRSTYAWLTASAEPGHQGITKTVGNEYGCKGCKIPLALHSDIISRNFRGQHGKAYLFDKAVNLIMEGARERNMTTGRHIVRDAQCIRCKETVGWKFDKAYESSERYKEGKIVLEAELIYRI